MSYARVGSGQEHKAEIWRRIMPDNLALVIIGIGILVGVTIILKYWR